MAGYGRPHDWRRMPIVEGDTLLQLEMNTASWLDIDALRDWKRKLLPVTGYGPLHG